MLPAVEYRSSRFFEVAFKMMFSRSGPMAWLR